MARRGYVNGLPPSAEQHGNPGAADVFLAADRQWSAAGRDVDGDYCTSGHADTGSRVTAHTDDGPAAKCSRSCHGQPTDRRGLIQHRSRSHTGDDLPVAWITPADGDPPVSQARGYRVRKPEEPRQGGGVGRGCS